MTRYITASRCTERLCTGCTRAAFFVLLGSGLVLYLPALSSALVGRRPLVKDIHFWTAVAWVVALALDRPARRPRADCARTMREIDLFDRDDRLLARGASRGRRAASTPARR